MPLCYVHAEMFYQVLLAMVVIPVKKRLSTFRSYVLTPLERARKT